MRLQFYKKKINIKLIRRLVYLVVVFVIAVGFFEIKTNHQEERTVTVVGQPTLPTMEITYFETNSLILNGYLTEMDPCYLRDAVIPLREDRNVHLKLIKYGNNIDELSYEVRSLDTQRKIAGNIVNDTEDKEDYLGATIKIESLIDKGEEYLLIITAKCDNQDIHFYTRIMEPNENAHLDECISFMKDFHNTALSDDASSLSTYMEPSKYVNKQSLQEVTINSTLSQVNYGGFDGIQADQLRVTVTDISSDYITGILEFKMSRARGLFNEYYRVAEYFRVRYTNDRMYLLDYRRTMEEILDENTLLIQDNQLNLGMTADNINYLSNETGTLVSFVSAGELYQYDQAKRTLCKVYGFIGSDKLDERSTFNRHEILVLNIDESGSMDYVVYGYMNAGDHEGCNGINLYHYDSISKESSEQVFIESTKSFEILKADFSKLLYETADEIFYIMISGTLLEIDLTNLKVTEEMSQMSDAQYAVSKSGRYFTWIDDEEVGEAIHVFDLETKESYDIKAPNGQLLKPLEFMGDDLVYGLVSSANIKYDGAGSVIYPMHELVISSISDGKEEQLMAYSKPDVYILDVTLDSYTMFLDRVKFEEDGSMASVDRDTIKNSAGEINKSVTLSVQEDEKKGEVLIMTMAELGAKETLGKIKKEKTGIVSAQGKRNVVATPSKNQEQYFVYIGNTVKEATDNLYSAICSADESMGVVIDNRQRYVWKRGRKSYQNSLSGIAVGSGDLEAQSSAKALSAMLVREGENVQVYRLLNQGETPVSVLERTLDVDALDLTGCSLNQVLYYVNTGTPVYARTGEDSAVLIVGYEASSIIYFDPDQGKNRRMGMQDASDMFEANGNVFISYIRK